MGIGIVNALSSEFIVESSILGVTHRVEFKEGIPWDKGEIVVKSKILFCPLYLGLRRQVLTTTLNPASTSSLMICSFLLPLRTNLFI